MSPSVQPKVLILDGHARAAAESLLSLPQSCVLHVAATEPDALALVSPRIARRLIPFLFLCYVLNYIDRVNISFAHLQFRADIGLTEASYGSWRTAARSRMSPRRRIGTESMR